MEETRLLHQRLYNAALEERISAYSRNIRISFKDQAKSLTQIRAEHPEYKAVIQRGQNMTLKRLDLAYKAFFRRVKAGQTPGFPRFKSAARFKGWSLCADEGYKYVPKISKKGRWFNGNLRLTGIGSVSVRGKSRNKASEVKRIDITKKHGFWFASLCLECEPERKSGATSVGLDWGVADYATLAYADGTTVAIANDRLFQKQQTEAADRQRQASKSLRGKRSNRAKRKHLQIARAHAKLANQRKDRAHKLSADLVRDHALIATEELQIANMTRSAKGTVEKPGKKVAQKAGLNREILDTAPGMLMSMLRYKAAEASTVLEFVNTRKVKPSQTCPQCGARKKKALSERVHACGCGLTMSRDGAAAWVMLLSSETYSGRKPTPG